MTQCRNDRHEGGCFCGAVRYRVDGLVGPVTHCHCDSCRRSAGVAFVTWFTIERERLAWSKGGVTEYPSSPGVVRGFCGTCGTELSYRNEKAPKTIDVTLGSLDCAAGHPAEKHIWTADKLEWLQIDDHLPSYEGWATEE